MVKKYSKGEMAGFKEAIDSLRLLLEDFRSKVSPYEGKGEHLCQLGDIKRALEKLCSSVEVEPRFLRVDSCSQCPHYAVDSEKSPDPWEIDMVGVCKQANNRRIKGPEEFGAFPSWCPLATKLGE